MRINSNIPALSANRQLGLATKKLSKASEKLSSGKDVNHASDNAAIVQILSREEAEVRFTEQANRNIDLAQAAATVADGYAQAGSDIATDRAVIAAESSNGALSPAQRGALKQIDDALYQESVRLQNEAQFNGTPLNGGSYNVQIGTDSSGGRDIRFAQISTAAGDVGTQAGARAALDSYRNNVSANAASRGAAAADFTVLDSAKENNSISILTRRQAISDLGDADIGKAASDLAQAKIQQYASANVLLNAKNQPQQALKLLKA